MAPDTQRPMADFDPVPEDDRPFEPGMSSPHPDDAAITSPADAAERLSAGGGPGVSTAEDGRRCAWLTGGGNRDDPFVLNWSGPLNSSYDYVTFGFTIFKNGQSFDVTDDGGTGYAWQWATKGSPYAVRWTPANLDAYGGVAPRAVYAIWNDSRGGYWGEAPCR